MATYKKRGGKPTTKAEKEISIEDESTTASIVSSLDGGASKTEEWVIKNQKYIFVVVIFVALLVLGFLGFDKIIQEPKERNATNDMFQSQQYFDKAVSELDYSEASLLAALPKAPSKYNPYKYPKVAEFRRNLVLQNLIREFHCGYEIESFGMDFDLERIQGVQSIILKGFSDLKKSQVLQFLNVYQNLMRLSKS